MEMPVAGRLSGLRVLVLEDDYLVAEGISTMLANLGCAVIGPVSSVDAAFQILKTQEIDAAVLDVGLTEGTSAPLARSLKYRQCPFVFVTGYNPRQLLPEDLLGCMILNKPVTIRDLESALGTLSRN